MDCRLQLSCPGLWEFAVPYSNPVILKTKKHFLGFLFHLWNLHQIWNIFKKRKIVIANVFPKLATVQGLGTPLTTQRRLKTFFDSQHVKRFETLVKSSWENFYHIFSSLLKILLPEVHVLTNNPMISNFNQGDIIQIISPHFDEKIC